MRIPLFFSFILTLAVSLATASLTHAQLIRGYGIKAGVSSSNVRSPDSFDTKRRTGFGLFAFMEWLGTSPLSIVTEAGYAQRGFATEQEGRDAQNNPTGTFRFEDRFDYLSLAAHAKVRWPSAPLAPYVLGGPRLDILLGGDPDGEGSLASSYSSTAVGGTFGAGVEISRNLPVALFAEIRYSFDVTNSLPDVPRDAYNNAFDVILGLRL